MLCEGEKMLGEALRSGAKLKTVLVRDGWDSPLVKEAEEQGASLYSAPDALFKLASEVETPQNVIFSCEQPQWTADALDEDSVPLSSVSLSKAAVIIGSEGKGVTEQALRLSDRRVIIPMKGRAESLNAGVAAAIVIYEMTK